MREKILRTPQVYGLKFEHIKLHAQCTEPERILLSDLINLPKGMLYLFINRYII